MAIPTIPVEGRIKPIGTAPIKPKITPIGTAPVTQPKLTPYSSKPVDPTTLTGAAERAWRAQNPNADYTKSVDMRNINQVGGMLKNNQGVDDNQMKAYQTNLAKWHMQDPNAPKPFDQNAFQADMQNNINGMYDAQQQAQLAQLKASRDKAIGQINLQDAQLAPQYADKRNQADVVSQQNVDRLRELMAANGLQSSGENVSASVGLQSARQGALNSLNTQEQQQHNDFAQRIADLNDPAQEQAVISELQAQRAQALLDATNRANDVGYQRQRDSIGDQRYNSETAYSHGRDAVGDQRYNSETAYSHGRDAVGDQRYNSETAYTHGRDAIGDQRYNSETTYTHGQDAIANKRADEAAKAAAIQQSKDNAWREHTFNNMSASEKAQLAKDVSQFGETKAWEMFQLKYNGELAKAQSKAQISALTP